MATTCCCACIRRRSATSTARRCARSSRAAPRGGGTARARSASGSRRSPRSIGNAALVHLDLLRQDLSYTAPDAAPLARLRGHRRRSSSRSASARRPRRSRSPISCCCGRCRFRSRTGWCKLWERTPGYGQLELSRGELSRLEAGQHGLREHRPVPQRGRQSASARRAAARRRRGGLRRSVSDAAACSR